MALTFGSLFAGIGGIDLGFERAGMTCKWQVEIDDYATRVLTKHWPDVRRWRDICTFPPDNDNDWRVDVIAGGFPCQDISTAGRGAGLAGKRSGLFFEAIRVVQQLRPTYVVLENVAALLTRGLDRVLGTLAEVGYDAEWHCIPASAVGAPHKRERVFIVAYASSVRLEANAIERIVCTQTTTSWDYGHIISAISSELVYALSTDRAMAAMGSGLGVCRRLPHRVDRLRGLGNSVVPQVAELIGRQLIEFHETKTRGQQ